MPLQLSAVIITYNEERNIARCIHSLKKIADEIVVVDSFSTDTTKAICNSLNATFYENPFEGHIEQKNYALQKASHSYVLSLDADEELSEDLKSSILKIKEASIHADAYTLHRLTNYCGKWIRHCGWYPDKRIRLWNKEKGKWGGTNPHDLVKMDGATTESFLDGDLLHYSYHSLSDHVKQMDKFSEIAAQEAFVKKKQIMPFVHVVLYPFFIFIRTYFVKLGMLDGYYGFVVSINAAFYRYLKYSKLRVLYQRIKS